MPSTRGTHASPSSTRPRARELRAPLGLRQERLGHAAGLDRTYIGGIERGERNVSLDNIWRLADALGVEPGELFRPPG
ncbi:helix-turn-helix domain-containing protein [uncultured Microbacterium sp.]|uniref:helix-turn-helix domain-containing protein n=1 Tax=uncultured Microbacterium sp. TaxID=191216 RepID=UPI0026116B19|nr:helix-turn-helix transcriptional regulator [uncultured Microbacterium sp.]